MARTAAAHVDPGPDEGMAGICAHTSYSTAQALPPLAFFTNVIYLCSISSERVNRIEEAAHSEVKPHFSDLIS